MFKLKKNLYSITDISPQKLLKTMNNKLLND